MRMQIEYSNHDRLDDEDNEEEKEEDGGGSDLII